MVMTIGIDDRNVSYSSSSMIMVTIRTIITSSTTITPTTAPVALPLSPPLLSSGSTWTPVMIT